MLSPAEQLNEQEIRMEPGWKAALKDEFGKEYFQSLRKFLKEEKREGQLIYPPGPQIFAAFNKTPFDRVKVVIIGQDPYHGEGQANGLCFSVSEGLSKPPSLVNIFKEMQADLGFPIPKNGSLEAWAAQGVLLLNATLTVRAGQAGSHQGKGWEEFTDAVIRTINEQCSGVVFLLWGNYAKGKGALIDRTRHFVLEAAHPSPLARTGFLGCRHFSKTNEILKSEGRTPVDWRLES